MGETRKLAAILFADIVGFSRLANADEERTLARLRALRGDLVDPAVAAHHGRVVKGTGDGFIVEFRSVVDALRCAIEIQSGLVERNAGLPPERRIEYRIGIHVGEVTEESDGDVMGDTVNIAARLEGIAKPRAICLSDDAYRQVRGRLEMDVTDLGPAHLKNVAEPMRVHLVEVRGPDEPRKQRTATRHRLVAPLATLAALAILVVAVAVGLDALVGRSTTEGSSAGPTASASEPGVAVTPATGAQPPPSDGVASLALNPGDASTTAASSPGPAASSSGSTAETMPGAENQATPPSHVQMRRQAKPAPAGQPDAEPTARRSARGSAKAQSVGSDPTSVFGESASGSSEPCFVSAAQTNANHVSCAYLRGQPSKTEPEQPRSLQTASDGSQPCTVSAAQTNANHVACNYLRGY